MGDTVVCHLCQRKFTLIKNLRTHCRKKHPNSPLPTSKKPEGISITNCISCPLCLCESRFLKHEELLLHITSIHAIDVERQSYDFQDYETFLLWKEQVEEQTTSRYVKTRGIRKCKDSETIIFSCCRSGHFKSRGKGLRHLKTQGTRKINYTCPARMNVKRFSDGKCEVVFIKTHLGHSTDVAHVSLLEKDRASLAQKISEKIPFQAILNELRESLLLETSVGRQHLITRKDLHNIEQCFNLNNESVKHNNDWTSVQAWVNEMNREGDSCVLFYKQQGNNCEQFKELNEEDFFLAIMNDAQGDMLKKFGHNVICIDATHGLNQYDFELVTLLTLDEMHQGFPCAFLFSNRTDEVALELFYRLVKNKVGEVQPSVFMSDMAESFYNGWVSVMNKPSKRLFCTWHVIKAWKQNIREKIRNKEKQEDVFIKVMTLLEETDCTTFNQISNKVLEAWKDDPETHDFAKYFETYYLKCSESWAFCHRLYSSINTNMQYQYEICFC
ncbi:uncharacterized protein LOC129003643 [Macrosteles quadrilineatus]|uniref:uncharacterized protein LOC129003643 n=1 Tax=Macrosteles quadrilineatus TaxID=74068 RepID=UPI0023E20776|nr:uncharacterized protein LOC129003643 [Macrosteles quadrilineatus]